MIDLCPSHQKQPTKATCGQTCIAMLVGIPVRFVIEEVFSGKTGKTTGTDLKEALSYFQISFGKTKIIRGDFSSVETCLIHVASLKKRPSGKPMYKHWIVHSGDRIYDPLLSEARRANWYFKKHMPKFGMRPASFFEIYGLDYP